MLADLALFTVLAACGSEPETPMAAPAAQSATLEGKHSANIAAEEELLAAFEADGIPDAEQWAREVVEYRPYPEDDPDFGKLREELAKYNPGPGILDQVAALLELP